MPVTPPPEPTPVIKGGMPRSPVAAVMGGILGGIILLWVFVLVFAVTDKARSEETSPAPAQRAPAARFSCAVVRKYVEDYGEPAARARALELRLPAWLIRRAERCVVNTKPGAENGT